MATEGSRLKRWLKTAKRRHWDGKVHENPPGATVIIIGIGYPPARRAWMAACRFFQNHWQWTISTALALVAILVTLA